MSEQIIAAARRSEIRELSLQVFTKKDANSGPLRPSSIESACIGLLNRPQQTPAHRSDSATPKASTLSFLDGKLREMASNTQKVSGFDEAAKNLAPKLFGVSLHSKVGSGAEHGSCQENSTPEVGQKRARAESWGPDESELMIQRTNHVRKDSSVLQRVGPSSKCVKTELELELRPSASVEAPWLRISAARDERVFI